MTGGSGDPNKAEIELDISGDAVEQAKELAKQLDAAADAEERLQKEMAKRDRVLTGLARQRQRERQRDFAEEKHRERQAERQRVAEDSRAKREADRLARDAERRQARAAASMPDAVARRRLEQAQHEKAVQARMDALTGRTQKTGLAGVAQAAESRFGLAEGSLSGMAGRASGLAGRFAGPAAMAGAAVAGAKFSVDYVADESQRMQTGNPYASDSFLQGRRVAGHIPFLGQYADKYFAVQDFATGRSRAIEKENRRRIETDASTSIRAEQFRMQLEQDRQEYVARAGVQSARSYAVPNAPDIDRSTARGEQQFRLAQRLLPLEERRAEASQVRANAEAEHSAALEKVRKIEAERDRLNRENESIFARTRSQKGSVGEASYVGAIGDMDRNLGRIEQLDRERLAAVDASKGTAAGLARARYAESQANIATAGERYQDLREREQTAADRAANLGRMGPLGQMQALNAMQMVERYGVGSVPPEVIAAAESAFPEKMRKLLEAEGSMRTAPFRSLSADDYRDDLGSIRAEANRAQQALQESKQTANVAQAEDLSSAARQAGVVGGESLGRAVNEVLTQAFDELVKTAVEQIYMKGLKEGYQLPASQR